VGTGQKGQKCGLKYVSHTSRARKEQQKSGAKAPLCCLENLIRRIIPNHETNNYLPVNIGMGNSWGFVDSGG